MEQTPITATSIPASMGKTIYPEPYAAQVAGRLKRKLGDVFGLTNFGVNLTHLAPGAVSALAHSHSKQDEFIYVLEGMLTLILDNEEFTLNPGECCGFKAGTGIAHQLINRSDQEVVYLEIGDRTQGDEVEYPNDDLKVSQSMDGTWNIFHKDGSPY
ncbi:MAG TPA: cupin domain-containing protein [Leptolyngbyaceae cyanobacterium M33_DOE_097]|uniref:Cupin domain-containing protein n=1 Tax=Oscillatoriales cyanobacterium SpSt-418 TaxID=2282169 RepID=A0A7C3PGV4_9CYAN|nr:cupin domain-containing protein [Leptolyngbyaceae cyanobacterium M33_DOE_097]